MRRHAFRMLVTAAALAAGLAAAEPMPSTPRPVPPLSADFSGRLTLPKISGLPPLAWRVQARPAAGVGFGLEATATAPGLELRVELTLPVGDAPGTWHVVQAKIDAASWWHLTVEQIGVRALPGDFTFAGQLTLEGSGQWHDSDATGTLHATLSAGTAGSETQRWSAGGLMLDAELAVASSRVVVRTAHVRVDTIQTVGITARNLVLDVTGVEGGRLSVTRAEVAALGGRLTLAPFTLDPSEPAVKTTADFTSVALKEIAAFVPQAIKEARGQLAGRVSINWSLKGGVASADGALAISPDEAATLRLAESPGLITSRAPARIAFLPASMGKLREWLSIENPAYDMLRRIELGQAPLTVETLNLSFYPDGPNGARTAQIRVVARPSSATDVVERVTFVVNVSGPLDQVLRLGLDKRANLKVRTGK